MSQLGVMAKYWEPGKVKTRLAAAVGSIAASQISLEFLQTTLNRFGKIAGRSTLVFSPTDRAAEFQALHPDWDCQPQSSGDLGDRMRHYFQSSVDPSDSTAILLIGADSPHLPTTILRQAIQRLEAHDVVLGPTDDGGYYLVGMKADHTAIFQGVNWSTPRVWQQTIALLEKHNLRWHELPPWYDVDELFDLHRLMSDMSEATDPACIGLRDALNRILATATND